jgi:hypothetical protein
MTIRSKIFPKHSKKKPSQVLVSETVSATVSITHYGNPTPEQELEKWELVLKTLTKTPNPSPQEALAREVVGKQLRELRKRIKSRGKRD